MPVSHHVPAIRLRRWLRQIILCAFVVGSLLFLGQSGAPIYSDALAAPALTAAAVDANADEPNAPHAPIPTTLEDYHLPGTQPNALDAPNAPLTTCGTCHVAHITDNYYGSMMANSARDPLFRAALRIANEDAAGSGEFCIRCHVPNAWLDGRSNPPDGSAFIAEDMQGISCNMCHRLVSPRMIDGETVRNIDERNNIHFLEQSELLIGSGAFVVDRQDFRRGPFDLTTNAHGATVGTVQDAFMRNSLMCGTCHEIDNPLITLEPGDPEFTLNNFNEQVPEDATMFPIERTYSEWLFSDFNTPAGVAELSAIYPGMKRIDGTEEGAVTVCQDCHMPLVVSPLTDFTADREVGLHQWAGGSARWQQGIEAFWDDVAGDTFFTPAHETSTLNSRELGEDMLARGVGLDLDIKDLQLTVTITNNTGHKLPTGYAEGRRMWMQITALQNGGVLTSLGTVDAVGEIVRPIKVYEIKLGITDDLAQEINRPEIAGEGFHFILNNKVFKDNRLPPRGWTNAEYATKHMQPVGVTYADGQYSDKTVFQLPKGTDAVEVVLWYQTASPEYLDFLAEEADDPVPDNIVGSPVNWGQTVSQLRDQFNLDQPVVMRQRASNVATLSLEKEVSPSGDLLPGQPISYTITFANPGNLSMSDVGLADSLPSLLSNITVDYNLDPSVTLNQTGDAPNLVWNVDGNLGFPIESEIIISGVISPLISADTLLSNSVVMSGTSAVESDNQVNRSTQSSAEIVVPRVQFVESGYSVNENGGNADITVSLDKVNPYAATTFVVSTREGTAKAGNDFQTVELSFTIPAGAASRTFSVPIVNDSMPENDQFFIVDLTSAIGGALGTTKSTTVTIVDEDPGQPVPEVDTYLPGMSK